MENTRMMVPAIRSLEHELIHSKLLQMTEEGIFCGK